MKRFILFLFFSLLVSVSFSGSYQTSISDSGSSTLEADKGNSCTGSSSSLFTTDISYSYDVLFTASTSSSLVSPSTALDFSVSSGTENIDTSILSNIPEIVFTASIFSLVDYSSHNSFTSEYFSDSDFSSYEQDYNTCEINTFSSNCNPIRGYFFSSGELECNGGEPAVNGNNIENYLVSGNGVDNPANYIEEVNGAFVSKQNKKQKSYLVCNGKLEFSASSSHTIDLSSLTTVSDTLPSNCFSPDANGLYKDSCDVPVDFSAKCYPVFADYYGSGTVYSYTMYSPVILSSSSVLTITDLCHGYIDSSISAPDVSMQPGSSTSYSFEVSNTGDLPIKIEDAGSISLTNGFTFTPSASITFPVEISPGETAVISGTLTSPDPMPSSFTITVTSSIDKNAVSCDGATETVASADVSVTEVSTCDISLEIVNTPTLCRGMTNEIELELHNAGSGDVIVDNYTLSLSTGPFYFSECNIDCHILQGGYATHYITVDVPNTPESSAKLDVAYHKSDDITCTKIASKDLPIIDCGPVTSFDLYPDDEEFINNYEGSMAYARFRVWNNITSSDNSPPGSTVNYTISSGSNVIHSPPLSIDILAPGEYTDYFETDEILCEGSITVVIQVNPGTEGDFNPDNNIIKYTEPCAPVVYSSGVCELKDQTGSYVTNDDVYLYPDTSTLLDLECYDISADGSRTLTLCEGTGSLTQNPSTSPATITGNLVYNDPVYSSLSITADPSPPLQDGDYTEFTVSIEKSLPGTVIEYTCKVTGIGVVSDCLDFM